MTQLAVCAVFFYMQSCKYALTPKQEKTKPLRVRNINFVKDGKTLAHNSRVYRTADEVVYTFESLKTDVKFETVILTRSNHSCLCTVIQTANIVDRILKISGAPEETHLHAYTDDDGKARNLHSHKILSWYRGVAGTIGKLKLGFELEDIGTHSNRLMGTMAMFLAHILICIITMIGRWASKGVYKILLVREVSFKKVC